MQLLTRCQLANGEIACSKELPRLSRREEKKSWLYASSNHSGKTITYLAAPNLASVSKGGGGVTIKWYRVSGATQYRVFRKVNGGGWKSIGVTSGTSFVDRNVQNNTSYTYTVRCLTPDGKSYAGGYDTAGLTIYYTN